MFEDIGVLSIEEFLRVVGLDPNPAFSKIAHIAGRGFLEAGIVLGFTIKLESFRINNIFVSEDESVLLATSVATSLLRALTLLLALSLL